MALLLLTRSVTLTCALTFVVADPLLNPLSDAYIDLINSKQDTWTAGRNFPEDTSIEYLKLLNGVINGDLGLQNLRAVNHSAELIASLPENFDPREKWPNCPSLNEIRDQGSCGSCWAFAAVSAMTDRYCIFSKGKQFHFSAEDLLSCGQAGDCPHGGLPDVAWRYWKSDGLVSGGNYHSNEGCRPYSIKPCIHTGQDQDGMEKCTGHDAPTPKCVRKCKEGYNTTYENDIKRGKNVHSAYGEDNMMAELYMNGPGEVLFAVYEDFLNYKNGVYKHLSDNVIGYHAVKLMGWGVEKGTKYWLVANSWNEHFGDKGFFKILRGANECGIEIGMVAGEPEI